MQSHTKDKLSQTMIEQFPIEQTWQDNRFNVTYAHTITTRKVCIPVQMQNMKNYSESSEKAKSFYKLSF